MESLRRRYQNAVLTKRECEIEVDYSNFQPLKAFRPPDCQHKPRDEWQAEGQITVSRVGVNEGVKELNDLDQFIEKNEKTFITVKEQPLEHPSKAMVSDMSLLTYERDNS